MYSPYPKDSRAKRLSFFFAKKCSLTIWKAKKKGVLLLKLVIAERRFAKLIII